MKSTSISRQATLALALGYAPLCLANPVDFTTGFTPGALDGQNNWSAVGGVNVDVGGVTDNGFDRAVLTNVSESPSPGDSFTSVIRFTFSVVADSSSGSPLLNVSFANDSDPANATGDDTAVHNRLAGTITRGGATGVRLRLYQNWGNRNPAENGVDNVFAQSGVFDNSLIGLDPAGADPMSVDGDEDLDSDLLELKLELIAGFNVDDWTAVVTLRNATTNMDVGSHTRSNISFDALGSPIFGGFGYGQGDGNVQVTSRVVSNYEFVSDPVASGSLTADFTAAEGYVDGNLNDNSSWSSQGSTVDSTGSGLATVPAFNDSVFSGLQGIYRDGATYEASMVFSFTDDATYTPPANPGDPITDISPANKPLLSTGIYNQSSAFSTAAEKVGDGITFAELTSNEVLIETSIDHGLSIGDSVYLSDIVAGTSNPNGYQVVTSIPAVNEFTFELIGDDETFTLGGSPTVTSTDSPQLLAGFNRLGGNYALKLITSWNSFSDSSNALPSIGGSEATTGELQIGGILPSDVGIDRDFPTVPEADLDSDQLKLTLTLTAGATNDVWDATMELFNLDSGTPDVALASKTISNITSFSANSLYAGFGGGQSDGNAKVSSRNIDSLTFSATYPAGPADIRITGIQFVDADTIQIDFSGADSSSYKLTSSPDLTTMFGDTGETATTTGGLGSFTYDLPMPVADMGFFRVEDN